MRTLAVMAGALMLMACSSGKDNTGAGSATPLTAGSACADDGATQCQANNLLTCAGGTWSGRDCGTNQCGAVTGVQGVFACNAVASTPDAPARVEAKQEFEACSDGDTCDAGLSCRVDLGICAQDCDPTNDQCGTDRVCQAVSEAAPNDGVCFNKTARRDEACLVNGNVCVEGECLQVTDRELACKITCKSTELGTQGSCPADEQCLPAPGIVEPQAPQTSCSTPNSAEGCNAAEGYSCFALAGGQNLCARRMGWCGTLSPMAGGLSDATSFVQNGSTCDMTTGHAGCGIVGATGTPAQTDCLEVATGPMGNSIGICIGVCSTDGDDLDCGTGYTCGRPGANDALFFEVQQNGEAAVSCTRGNSSTCDTANEYSCNGPFEGNTFQCSRPSKICLSTGA